MKEGGGKEEEKKEDEHRWKRFGLSSSSFSFLTLTVVAVIAQHVLCVEPVREVASSSCGGSRRSGHRCSCLENKSEKEREKQKKKKNEFNVGSDETEK